MPSAPFLTIDGAPLTLASALRYLHAAGSLASFIGEILRQYVLDQELRDHTAGAQPLLVELAVADFRRSQGLGSDEDLREWLELRGQDLAAFRAGVERDVRVERLKQEVTEPLLGEYFADRRAFLDRVRLSRVVAATREEAAELLDRVQAGTAFDALERERDGARGEYRWMDLPPALRDALAGAVPGAVAGPVELAEGWSLVRLEAHLPASFEDPVVRDGLREELFERWLGERLERLSVELWAGEE